METLHPFDNDALLVDDLLDFSNGDIGGLCEEVETCEATVCGEKDDSLCCQNPAQKSAEATVSLSSLEASGAEALYTPPDELAELEWLSSFVEDSYTTDRPLLGSKVGEEGKLGGRYETDLGGRSESECFQSQWLKSRDEEETFYNKNGCELLINKSNFSLLEEGNPNFIEAPSISNSCDTSTQAKNNSHYSSWGKPSHTKGRTRSRRPKSEGRIWSLHMLVPSSHHHSSKRPAQHEYQDYEDDVDDDFFSQVSSLDYEPYCLFHKHKKKAKKAPSPSSSSIAADDGLQEEGQRCSHCQVQKTPQWRAGPLGPKTLCNACGVRYKSGRLVPEYRPAASPTFVNEIHSNSHKKILEMRLYKSQFGEPEEETLINTRMSEEESTCSQESMTSQLDA